MTEAKNKRPGVITLEIELAKPLSRQKKVVVEYAWHDMNDLPVRGDNFSVDRVDIGIDSGPASDEVILSQPETLQDFTWQCTYPNTEWTSAQDVLRLVKNDPKVLSAKVLQ